MLDSSLKSFVKVTSRYILILKTYNNEMPTDDFAGAEM